MNHTEIKEKIAENFQKANLCLDELRVQPAPFSGWQIVVVSSEFEGKSDFQRRQIVLQGLENLPVEWLEVLTPDEKNWAGTLIVDSPLENLPLWPDALARSSEIPEEIVFPSDLDEDLELPIIATFYSLRGGVGRSTALAYTARILARRGRTILCVDMDLEAPGLAALFGKEKEIRNGQGLLFLLLALDREESPNIQEHILRISETDELYCLPAGKPDANYARLLNFINPEAWYREERNPLRELIDLLSNSLTFKPDVILLDARTGITPLNAPLLFDLADLAVIVFFPHPQTKEGTGALVKALLASTTRREGQILTPEPRFLVSPIPASRASEIIEKYQHRSLEWIGDWLEELGKRRSQSNQIIESDITHFIPYREVIATSDEILSERDIWQDFEPVADWVELFLPTRHQPRLSGQISLSESKSKILEELEFSAGTAEYQNKFLETFVATDLVNRALEPKTPLVLGRKGTGKTAIFRRIMEGSQRPSVVVMSPSPLKKNNFWIISPDGFKEIEKFLNNNRVGWREFWMLQTCLACYSSQENQATLPDDSLAIFLNENLSSELQITKNLEKMLTISSIGLLARDWLQRLDLAIQSETILLFDGLDTGFGNTKEDRDRRSQAIEGLFSLVTDIGDNLHYLKFKILLREDIWRKLSFENKSHFYGRSVTLKWDNQADFFKVIIKQALCSQSFQELTQSIVDKKLLDNYDYWLEAQVFEVWNLLVGERMKGGKSAFTRNWVWNRLADGSNNRSPRTLLQLFVAAKEWEIREQNKSSYGKSIIRSRALSSSLETVSKEALDALIKEEFTELQNLVDKLKELGRSPLKADELSGFTELLRLGLEVGLLEIYEGTDEEVKRYKVPDLYRLGIGMTRKGQA
jgi:cellulose biosynthesis protein BcsQ/acid stress-induced BolA-like protein IbaG/YrbA